MAGNAALRPDQSSRRCASFSETRIAVAPLAVSTARISAISAATSTGVPSASTSSTAAASSG